MFSPSSFTASTPCETAVCACSTTPVATRFTRASGDVLRPPPVRFPVERFAVDFFAPPRFAAPREVAPRADDFFAELFLAALLFAPPFFAAPLRAPPFFAPLLLDERLAPRLAPPRRAEPLPALRLLPPFFFVAIAASPLPVGGSRVLREIVAVCARFGRMVASGALAATSEATAFVVQPRDNCMRERAHPAPHACRTRRRRFRKYATTRTWSPASRPASGTTMLVASSTLAGRRVPAHH